MRRGWETVRVFISSTFRDMHAEREHLVKEVFPRLREQLEKHRLHLLDIDLRWGVTEEQAENHQALELCLEEIDRCRPGEGGKRPFFIGIIGQRYGHIPREIPPAALGKYPWLASYPDHSLTALEVVHAIVLDPPLPLQAFFYTRDPAFLGDVPQPIRQHFFDPDTPQAKCKLRRLQGMIADAGVPIGAEYPCTYAGLRLNFALLAGVLEPAQLDGLRAAVQDGVVSPDRWEQLSEDGQALTLRHGAPALDGLQAFGDQVQSDLLDGIAQQYPEVKGQISDEPAMDPLAAEADLHERFVETRLRVCVGREDTHGELLDYLADGSHTPITVLGPAGCGKSTVLARLCQAYRAERPETLIVPYFVGASPTSTSLASMLAHLCHVLRQRFDLPGDEPTAPEELPATFRRCLGMVPREHQVVVVLDAVDQLDAADLAAGLGWLPYELPRNVGLVVSCLEEPDEAVLAGELRERGVPVVEVPPLSPADCAEIIDRVPALSARTLDRPQRELLLADPATRNPLYLRVALEELRGFGSFELLTTRIKRFSQAANVTELFSQVFERLELEYGRPLIGRLCGSLAASRAGLRERELHGLVGDADPRSDLPSALRQLRPYLLRRGELIDYYHKVVGTAAAGRYPADDSGQWHLRLADYFDEQRKQCLSRSEETSPQQSPRWVYELPWQLRRLGAWERLQGLLGDLAALEAMWSESPLEVKRHWSELRETTGRGPADVYAPIVSDPGRVPQTTVLESVAELLGDMGHSAESAQIWRAIVDRHRREGTEDGLSHGLGQLATTLRNLGRLDEALAALEEQDRIHEKRHPRTALRPGDLGRASILRSKGEWDAALELLGQWEAGLRQTDSRRDLAAVLLNEAMILADKAHYEAALRAVDEAQKLAAEVSASDILAGAHGTRGQILYSDGELEHALEWLKREEQSWLELGAWIELSDCVGNQASVLADMGQRQEALRLHLREEELCRRTGYTRGLCKGLFNQALLRIEMGEREKPGELLDEGLCVAEEMEYAEAVADCLSGKGLLSMRQGDLEEALVWLQKAEVIAKRIGYERRLNAAIAQQESIRRMIADGGPRVSGPDESPPMAKQRDQARAAQLELAAKARYEAGEPKEALGLLKELERIYKRLGDAEGLERCRHNRAGVERLFTSASQHLSSMLGMPVIAPGPAFSPVDLHRAVGANDITRVRVLIGAGADVNYKTQGVGTPLHHAASNGFAEIAEALVEAGADVNATTVLSDQTPLHNAAFAGSVEIAALLLDRGADIGARDRNGRTPLLQAAAGGHSEMAEFLVARGADVSVTDNSGQTPLHLAAQYGHRECVEYLLQQGADTHIRSGEGRTAADLAQANGYHDLAELIRRH